MNQKYTVYKTVETARADGADWELCWLPYKGFTVVLNLLLLEWWVLSKMQCLLFVLAHQILGITHQYPTLTHTLLQQLPFDSHSRGCW